MGNSRLVYSNYLSQFCFYISHSGLAHLPTNRTNVDSYSTKKFYEAGSSLQAAKNQSKINNHSLLSMKPMKSYLICNLSF